ncbi:hypothetical protein MMB17_23325 [Methylobacterium organophilum]|uniref:hypothetical protein n=1 Tax=Methylobacterium organophilum TaxID=410 RepID=UPI001F13B050|nr:hypothetical protein [Methylobacterium organophilum]UMY17511.1 hypothetical protein MMB17_23325 [Methylobacterium organophilum]
MMHDDEQGREGAQHLDKPEFARIACEKAKLPRTHLKLRHVIAWMEKDGGTFAGTRRCRAEVIFVASTGRAGA